MGQGSAHLQLLVPQPAPLLQLGPQTQQLRPGLPLQGVRTALLRSLLPGMHLPFQWQRRC